ncbi:hypothetical protein Q5P01_008342 [Channa striata]|uniref:DUF4585 domain-containing protein n=1 Tax=Channa striata TaxID=64152 RepID=A0AA88N9Z9_CHASR|nr:hypothetical protein Q5P01_008342 [Channa striata]
MPRGAGMSEAPPERLSAVCPKGRGVLGGSISRHTFADYHPRAEASAMKTEQRSVDTLREIKLPAHGTEDAPDGQDKSKYVDLELVDVKTESANPGKDWRPGDTNPPAVPVSSSGAALRATEPKHKLEIETEKKENSGVSGCAQDDKDGPTNPTRGPLPQSTEKRDDCLRSGDIRARAMTQSELSRKKDAASEEESPCTDRYLSERSGSEDDEEDDDVSLVLSDDCVPCAAEDESHYITTHEIQLSELSDRDKDYDLGVGSSSSWDTEADNQVYSFVDYASFGGDGAATERGDRRQSCPQGAAAVSTLRVSDPCDGAKFASSDESVSGLQQQQQQQQQTGGSGGGQIRLSIRTTSRAINDPSNIQERGNILYHARRSGDMSRYVLRGVDGKAERLCDRAKCFPAAPGRPHSGGKLRGKEVTDYSSGASSAVSELDDADKEVRTLTARAFRSLAHPYLDAIHFSNSSESSASEYGLGMNGWSTFVDLKYGNVNMSRGLDQSVVSHQNKAALELARNLDSRGIALASIKPPHNKVFALKGNPHSASSSTKQIELMGKFSQGHSGVIRLTETLNFRCNVKSGTSGEERHTEFAQNTAGSRAAEDVPSHLPSAQRSGASKTMEDPHKKSIFASSVIKNVISKKMQFEQERKMERGEIREPHQESDCHRGKGSGELDRQSSSDYALMCAEELGDIVDSGSCDTKGDCRGQDTAAAPAPAPETGLVRTNEAGFDPKKGTLEASKGTLLRSQNSAFRCWKDEELEFQKDHKNGKTLEDRAASAADSAGEAGPSSASGGKRTKMSHLFVPSIQLLPSNGDVGQQPRSRNDSARGDVQTRSDSSTGASGPKSPEIQINLRSVRDNKTEPFGVSKLRAPNIGRTDDFKCQALAAALKGESSDKVPHFLVRDIRDNKGKLQTPIHQVRDVRKLVKSSYHFVSLDNNDNKSNVASADRHPEQRKQMPYRNPNSVSPIVIKCQSVNTNSNGKQPGNPEAWKQEQLDTDRSSPEGAKSAAEQRAAVTAATSVSNSVSEGGGGVGMESKTASKKQEKTSEVTDKKPESRGANQVALEKLQAAVKTMEQLYVFEKNEWKRRNEPRPLTDSHVLSLLTSEVHGGPEDEGAQGPTDKAVRRDSDSNAEKSPPPEAMSSGTDGLQRWEDKDPVRALQGSNVCVDRVAAKSVHSTRTADSEIMLGLRSSFAAATTAKTQSPNISTQAPFGNKNLAPKSLKVSQTRYSGHEGAESKEVDRSVQELFGTFYDSENYLTIPVKSRASSGKQPLPDDKTSVHTVTAQSHLTTSPGLLGSSTRAQEDLSQTSKRSSIATETCSSDIPSATIYHSLPLGISTNQPQVYCFSPAITPAPTLDPFQATQRKMLLDPTTGNYYLVDTPVQPSTKRLFDPETGQYVDVPMPQPPMTPVPMPISPLALSPAAYGHTYMIYPGFMPAPSVIPARTLVQTQMSVQSDAESVEKVSAQQTEGVYMESPFYMATGRSPQAVSRFQQQAPTNRLQAQGFSSIKQPVISITTDEADRVKPKANFTQIQLASHVFSLG